LENNSMREKCKIAFLIDNDDCNHHYLEILEKIMVSNSFQDPVFISDKVYLSKIEYLYSFKRLKSLPRNLLLKLIAYFENFFLKRDLKFKIPSKDRNLKKYNLKILRVCSIKSLKNVRRFSENDISVIKKEKFDVIIRCGNGILKGEILESAKHGIFSFHHGDNREFRGMPSGFWEVYNNALSTGFIIQKLTEDLDRGYVLARGNIPTASYWQRNNALITYKSINSMINILKQLSEGELPKIEKDQEYSEKIYNLPSTKILIKYILKQLYLLIIRLKKRLLGVSLKWEVRIIKSETVENLHLQPYFSLTHPNGASLADPFLFQQDGEEFCFVEEIGSSKKGVISTFKIEDSGPKYLGRILEEDFHLSFPYIFEYENEIYMCPETSSVKEIRLYKCIEFPCKWVFEKTLVSGVDAVDSMIICKEGQWFLMTTYCNSNSNDHNSELNILIPQKNNPLSETWFPVGHNPVVFDSRSARNGGLARIGDKLLRVGQIHAKGFYGYGINLNEIIKIEKNIYIEKKINTITPNKIEGIKGIHHLSKTKRLIAYDVCFESS